MNGLITFLEQKVSPIAAKIGGQRHMLAVRKGIISTLPLTLVGSFFVIFLFRCPLRLSLSFETA